MDLSVDSSFTLLDLEGSFVTPGVVPGVYSEPEVFTSFGSPSDEFDGVTSESLSRLVSVYTTLVGEEIFVDSESGGDSSVLEDVRLDVVNSADAVGGAGVLLVSRVVDRGVGLAAR